MTPELEEVTGLFFRPFLGKSLLVNSHPRPLPIMLRDVSAKEPPYWPKGWRKPFTLIFETPRSHHLTEGQYEVYGDGFGPLKLYIIPIVTPDPAVQHYQAVFN